MEMTKTATANFIYQTYYYEDFSITFRYNIKFIDVYVDICFFYSHDFTQSNQPKRYVHLGEIYESNPYIENHNSFLKLIQLYVKENSEKIAQKFYKLIVEVTIKTRGI